MADLQFSAAINDTEFVDGLQRLERQAQRSADPVNRSFGRWGASIKDSTEGMRRFTSAISSTVSVATRLVGVATAIGAGLIGAVALVDQLVNGSEEAARRARDITDDIRRGIEQDERSRRLANPDLDEFERRRLEIFLEARDRRGRLGALQNEGLSFERIEQLRQEIDAEEQRADAFVVSQQNAARLKEALDALQSADAAATAFLNADEDEIERVNRQVSRLIVQLADARSQFADDDATRSSIDAIIQRVREEGDARIEQIERVRAVREEDERRREAAERAQREFDERALDIQLLRARGLDAEADAARVRLDIERQIRELELDPARTEEERERIRRKLVDLQQLQLASIGETPETSRAIALQGSLLTGAERQVFGTRDPAAERFLARQEQANAIFESIKALLDGASQAGAIRVVGDFGARLN